MSIAPDIVSIAEMTVPDDVCFVPEKRKELTTEGGLDILSNKNKIGAVVHRLKKKNIRVSVFIDPVIAQIKAAKEIGADFVELHTGSYADAKTPSARQHEFVKLKKASEYVLKLNLGLNAGHGLDYKNAAKIAQIEGMNELNIGYSIICRAVYTGLFAAVKEMNQLISK
jgi:pyridoxine 5-phosphate synthase